MTKAEFHDWLKYPQTIEVFEIIQSLINEGKEELAHSAGQDPVRDRYIVGKIIGLSTIIEMEYHDD